MMRYLTYTMVIGVLIGFTVDAQQQKTKTVTTINVSAVIVGNVDVIVMKDLEIEIANLSPAEFVVNPQSNPNSGKIKLVGDPNSLVRVTNEKQSILQHENGQSQLYFTYNISGNTTDVQSKSALLTQNNEIRLGDRGVYYLWIGGQLSGLENIMPGNYTMELKIEVEYIL